MRAFFKELCAYGHHYNQKLIAVCLEQESHVPEKTQKLLSHVVNAQSVWNSRLDATCKPSGVWDLRTFQDLAKIDAENYANTLAIIDALELEQAVSYTNTKGQAHTNTVRDILFHIVNHSTYHRGQIASDLKQAGIEPPVTDYIFYKWEQ